MNKMEEMILTPRGQYSAPMSRIIPVIPGHAICGSPLPGGNEDIGYEDWD